MKSPIDNEVYITEIKYDNYKEWPLYIEFLEPDTLQPGTKRAYPSSKGDLGGFFIHKHAYVILVLGKLMTAMLDCIKNGILTHGEIIPKLAHLII